GVSTVMKKLRSTTLVILVSFVSFAHADISQDKREEIEKMLRLTGMEKLMTQISSQMTATLRKQTSSVPQDFWDKFERKIDMHGLIEKIIPIYDKYYTLDDLKAVN